MGMFDSVYVDCKCGEKVEFQSKAGDCLCHDYTIYDLPHEIALDLNKEVQECGKCGNKLKIHTKAIIDIRVEYY